MFNLLVNYQQQVLHSKVFKLVWRFSWSQYLVYLLRLITPFVSRSVAALLNISSEMGSVVSPSDVYLDLWFLLFGPLTS